MFGAWGAFRDGGVPRCYAIAAPGGTGAARPGGFASVGFWPGARVRGQFYLALNRPRAASTPITLTIGNRRFALVGNGVHGWAADARGDAAIIAAMRGASAMRATANGRDGRPIAIGFGLRGAATAIDAAAVGCAGLGRPRA